MNMKHKLTYMLIGCLFTLAGFVLSNLTNTPTQAQDEKVIDEIVCKKLKIVNDQGNVVARLFTTSKGKGGHLVISNADKKDVVYMGPGPTGNGRLVIYTADEKDVVNIVAIDGNPSFGAMATYTADGKKLVSIGVEGVPPNDGVIKAFNHKGKWRSFTADGTRIY